MISHAFWKMITGLADITKVKVLIAQLCLILCDAVNCRSIPFSRGSSLPRDREWVSCIAGRFFTVGATKEACADVECYVNTFQKYMQELIKPRSISTQVVSWQLSPSGNKFPIDILEYRHNKQINQNIPVLKRVSNAQSSFSFLGGLEPEFPWIPETLNTQVHCIKWLVQSVFHAIHKQNSRIWKDNCTHEPKCTKCPCEKILRYIHWRRL